jgi:hypothetical protein
LSGLGWSSDDKRGRFNEYAVPGSYWGVNPRRWVGDSLLWHGSWVKGPGAFPVQDTLTGSPGENLRQLVRMNNDSYFASGIKEFVLIVRFTGRYFDDVRVVWSGSLAWTDWGVSRYVRSYFDFYPPCYVAIDRTNTNSIANGDTLKPVFDYYLSAVQDKGRARIFGVSLIIAEAPAAIAQSWHYWEWNGTKDLPVTFDDLMAQRHIVYPFKIDVAKNTLADVWWPNIDIRSWRSGKYFIGIIARDEWGNEGLAPVSVPALGLVTNPIMVTVLSGQ